MAAPRPLVFVSGLVLAAGLAMTFIGACTTGTSLDEPAHAKRLENFMDRGLYARGTELEATAGSRVPINAYVYGPVTARTMHVANEIVGNEAAGEVSRSQASFTVRHLVVAAMSVVGLLAVAVMAWLLLGSWTWGVVAAGVLAAIPMWTGHAMFNPKDTPVAVGYTIMTAGLVAVALKRHWLLGCLAMVSGIVLMVGTRPGMWAGVAAGVAVLVGAEAAARKLDKARVVGVTGALVVAYGLLWKAYPKVFSDPITMMLASASGSATFAHAANVEGSMAVEKTAVERPALLLGLAVLGLVVAAVVGWRHRRNRRVVMGLTFTVLAAVAAVALILPASRYLLTWTAIEWPLLLLGLVAVGGYVALRERSTGHAVVGAQILALAAAAAVSGTGLYDGLRQMLFIVPAMAVFATVGMAWCVRRWGRVAVVAAIAALILPTIVQLRMFPYQYAYENVAAEVLGAPISNDYWETSFRELTDQVPPTVRTVCPHWASSDSPIRDDLYPDCRNNWSTLKPSWLAHWHHARTDPDAPNFYALLPEQSGVPTNCTVVDRVIRARNFERATMSRLLLCTK